MRLSELVAPVFLFVVALRRKISRNVPLEHGEVKREALGLFARLEREASTHALTDRWERAKVTLAYLVDEEPTVKGVLADLLHLATLGLISVDLRKSDFTIVLSWGKQIDEGEVVQVEGGEEVTLAKHERTLFNTLLEAIKWTNRPTRFSDVHTFTSILPAIYTEMGEAATQYFSTRPDEARRRWN